MVKNITPVAMIVTEQQFKRDLEIPLKKLGYIGLGTLKKDDFHLYNYLTNNYNKDHGDFEIGTINEDVFSAELKEHYIIEEYNPELFLALAAMTDGDISIVGEYMICIKETNKCDYKYTLNEIFPITNMMIKRITSESGKGVFSFNYDRKFFRKATKEKLIQFFNEKMKKTIIGYKLKEEFLDSKTRILKSIAMIGLIHNDMKNPNEDRILKTIFENQRVRQLLEEAHILDMWLTPIYEESKVNDWVVVTEEIPGNNSKVGTIGRLQCIDKSSKPYLVNDSWCINVRKATPREIESIQGYVVDMGSFQLRVEKNNVYHKNEDITDFVKSIKFFWENTLNHGELSFNGYTVKFEDIILTKTGCENSNTSILDWVKIANSLK